jgi:hypothetical protein
MDAEDWLKGAEKKLVIAQCTDHEKVLSATHQLYGTAANWWETYCNTHANVNTITWNEFKAHFHTYYVPNTWPYVTIVRESKPNARDPQDFCNL